MIKAEWDDEFIGDYMEDVTSHAARLAETLEYFRAKYGMSVEDTIKEVGELAMIIHTDELPA